MGKITKQQEQTLTFTPLQKLIFDEFSQNKDLVKQFYFTGGTALSAIYLHHRESEDLDFFSEDDFDNAILKQFIDSIEKKLNVKIEFTQVYKTRMFNLYKNNKLLIKIDFNHYPYKRLKKGLKVQGVEIDTLRDIATNKLQTISSRTQIKDFVDLFFLLKEFTVWDLIYGLEPKFRVEFDFVMLSSSFLKIKQFDTLPKMLVPLTLRQLQEFYKEQAKKIAARVVTK